MTYFFCRLENLIITDEGIDFMLFPGVRISNNEKVKSLLMTEGVKAIIGNLEFQKFKNCKTFLYHQFDDNAIKIFNNSTQKDILANILTWVDDFLKNSWVYRDNCIYCGIAYLMKIDNNETETCDAQLLYRLSLANNENLPIEIDANELDNLVTNHLTIEKHFHETKSHSLRFMMEKSFSRVARSLIFVKQAREARNSAYRISNYCSALETLFSTDTTELSYKLSQRIAFFVNDHFPKQETYKTLKTAYAIRSKLTHGDVLNEKQISEICNLSKSVDDILRVALTKVIFQKRLRDIFESKKNEDIEQYFENLIFN